MADDVQITTAQFAEALQAIEMMTLDERRQEANRLSARGARGYYVVTGRGKVSMKLVTRRAYDDAGLPWPAGEGPQSGKVFRNFKHEFTLLHEPQARGLKGHPLEQQSREELTYVQRLARPEQAGFRRALLARDARCVLTGCIAVGALEAAHIQPVAGKGGFDPDNGLLLRADLHRLFDLGYLAIHPKSGTVWLHKSCRNDYRDAIGSAVLAAKTLKIARAAFKARWSSRVGKT